MGHVEIADGISVRRIKVPSIDGVIRIELTSDPPCVVVPDSVMVTHNSLDASEQVEEPDDSEGAEGSDTSDRSEGSGLIPP